MDSFRGNLLAGTTAPRDNHRSRYILIFVIARLPLLRVVSLAWGVKLRNL